MPSLEEARENFNEALELLGKVETREDGEEARKRLKAARKALWDIDSDFRSMVEENQRQHRMRIDEERARYDAKLSEAKWKSEVARRKAEAVVGDGVPSRRFNVLTPNEVAKKARKRMVCPICGESGRGNMVNQVPTCCHDTSKFGPWHKLVPKDTLKDYNRAYRRRWKKS